MSEASRDFLRAVMTHHALVDGYEDAAAAVRYALDAGSYLWVVTSDVPRASSELGIDTPLIASSNAELDRTADALRYFVPELDGDIASLSGVLIVDGPAALVRSATFAEVAADVAGHPDRYGISVIYRVGA